MTSHQGAAVPVDRLTLGAAALTGLMGGVHCAAMCGGIATGFSAMAPRVGWRQALEPNLGRMLGYIAAGAVAGGIGGGVVRIARSDWLALGLRMAVGAVLVVAALRLLDRRGRLAFIPGGRGALWQRLRPLQRRLLPASTTRRLAHRGRIAGVARRPGDAVGAVVMHLLALQGPLAALGCLPAPH